MRIDGRTQSSGPIVPNVPPNVAPSLRTRASWGPRTWNSIRLTTMRSYVGATWHPARKTFGANSAILLGPHLAPIGPVPTRPWSLAALVTMVGCGAAGTPQPSDAAAATSDASQVASGDAARSGQRTGRRDSVCVPSRRISKARGGSGLRAVSDGRSHAHAPMPLGVGDHEVAPSAFAGRTQIAVLHALPCVAIAAQSPCVDASRLVVHPLFRQVPLVAVQSMHAVPPLPQYWSKDPLRHMPDVSQQPPVHVCGPHGGPASSGVHIAIMRLPAIVTGAQTSPAAHSAVVAQSWTGPIGVALGQGEGRQAEVGWVLVTQHTRPGGAPGLY